jgi:hypothetical protein
MQENPTFHLLIALGEFALRLVFASIEKFYKEQSDFAKKIVLLRNFVMIQSGIKISPTLLGIFLFG